MSCWTFSHSHRMSFSVQCSVFGPIYWFWSGYRIWIRIKIRFCDESNRNISIFSDILKERKNDSTKIHIRPIFHSKQSFFYFKPNFFLKQNMIHIFCTSQSKFCLIQYMFTRVTRRTSVYERNNFIFPSLTLWRVCTNGWTFCNFNFGFEFDDRKNPIGIRGFQSLNM